MSQMFVPRSRMRRKPPIPILFKVKFLQLVDDDNFNKMTTVPMNKEESPNPNLFYNDTCGSETLPEVKSDHHTLPDMEKGGTMSQMFVPRSRMRRKPRIPILFKVKFLQLVDDDNFNKMTTVPMNKEESPNPNLFYNDTCGSETLPEVKSDHHTLTDMEKGGKTPKQNV